MSEKTAIEMEKTSNIKKEIELEISKVLPKLPSSALLEELAKRAGNDGGYHLGFVERFLLILEYPKETIDIISETMRYSDTPKIKREVLNRSRIKILNLLYSELKTADGYANEEREIRKLIKENEKRLYDF